MNLAYRVFLYSSDVDRLTHEGDYTDEEQAKAAVQSWIGDNKWDEELAAGRFRIDTLRNSHLRGAWRVNVVARTEAYMQACKDFSTAKIDGKDEDEVRRRIETEGKKQKVVLQDEYPIFEEAKLESDRAIDDFLLNSDPILYSRIQRKNRNAGIHKRFITDAAAFGFQIYAGEYAISYRFAEDTTLEELKAISFKPEGIGQVAPPQYFSVESGAMRVTDPCYEMDVWCAGTAENVMNGRWSAQVQYFNEAFDSYSLERWNEMLANFGGEESKLIDKLVVAGEDIDPARMERLVEIIKSRALEDFHRYGNPDDWKGRVAYLHVRHESVLNEPIDPFSFVRNKELDVGVDSGQAGFFDLAKYAEALADKCDSKRDGDTVFEKFYDACGENTLGTEQWGVVNGMGVASLTAFGDGSYTLCERRNEAGELIEARIVYTRLGSEMFPGIGGDEEDEGEEDGE